MQDVDYVVHCAGTVRGASYKDFAATNVVGTEHIVATAEQMATPPPLLMLSSIVAREPQLSWYASSKRAGEDVLTSSKLHWCVLRPPAVYGPGDREMLAIFEAMSRGFAPVAGSRSARNSLIHVDDLVQACLFCLGADNTYGHIYELHDGREGGYDWDELAEIASTVYQRPVRALPIPRWLLNTVATINLGIARVTGGAPMLTPAKLRELRHPNWVASNQPLTAACGWQPQIGLEQGLDSLLKAAL